MGFMDDINNEEFVEENVYIENANKGLELISKLQSVNEDVDDIEKKFNHLEKLLEEDYLELVNKSSYPEEAKTYRKLVRAQKKIEEMIKFSFLANKHIVAVGGGFSSGKSKFINSLVGKETLPTDTKPTTSIPTFLAKGKEDRIYPYNIFGNKTEIDQEALQAITHAFHEKYKLSFTRILKSVNLQFEGMPYENIIFLDTPGYTKSDYQKQADNTDKAVAKKHLQVADYLIWVVDINQGTIPKEDLDFINDLKLDKDILIILNKADTKIKKEIQDIIKVTKANLKRAGINTVGVTAYSSLEKKIYFKDELNSFLNKIEKDKKKADMLNTYNNAFDNYINYHEKTIENERNKLSNFNKFYLLSSESEDNMLFIDDLITESKKKIKREKNILKNIKELKKDYIDQVKNILEDMDIDYIIKKQNYIGTKSNNHSQKNTESKKDLVDILNQYKSDKNKNCKSKKNIKSKESISLNESDSSNMVLVEAGITSSDNGSIKIDNDFYIGKYSVTQSEFEDIMGFNPSYINNKDSPILRGNSNNRPVERVTWYDAIMYCNKLSEKKGLDKYYNISEIKYSDKNVKSATVTENLNANGYRLPTKEEHEYAARGGKDGHPTTYAGSDYLNLVGWYWDNSNKANSARVDKKGTMPVGKKKDNELGIYDMCGNVRNWTNTHSGCSRIRRGGSWLSHSYHCEVGNSSLFDPSKTNYSIGFRITRSF